MDLDAYVSAHRATWERLDALSRHRRLTGAEADEMIDTYQRVATHLSVIRSTAPDASLVAYLSALLARARGRATGTRVSTPATVIEFFTRSFPAALYRMRWWWLSVMGGSLGAAVIMTWWVLEHPRIESSFASPGEIERLVTNDFENYYSEYEATSFAARVWTNNFWLAALCIALGVFGFPVIWMLYTNVLNLVVVASIMIRHGRGDLFFGLILPHGMLELTCLFVAAGVGLRIFWAWVSPGNRTRAAALGEEGRAAVGVALGLVVVLLLCGVIEAFVTPSPLPTWARIGIGVTAWSLFMAYVFVAGRRAYEYGDTGDLDEADRGLTAPTVR
ncbi:stage II sporulation protein M [Gordonia McavH-238-E]|uniref:Stage II sporulation protein M n=1 Tax=Gordonia terrae TaxID=2055 RepID=A0A2I1R7Y6_9ACTN|nr:MULTISPECIES: stage II sporulation protein M [Gordonia]MCG7634935.1 stage II sporulation protein M [Gordonia sp. McavH-238-E]PKZ65189.1 stage II sporulation protein M [Gordonia terrae]UPW09269.1 stage II sporulation protein M [Gordonia terrae]